jgi:hypothetical protein
MIMIHVPVFNKINKSLITFCLAISPFVIDTVDFCGGRLFKKVCGFPE